MIYHGHRIKIRSEVSAPEARDLDGYQQYLNHPAHIAAELGGIPLMARFETFDITDDDDPEFDAKIDELQRDHVQSHPEVAELLGSVRRRVGGCDVTRPER